MLRGFTPQAALDAPRFCISAGSPDSVIEGAEEKAGDINSEVYFEEGIAPKTVETLRSASSKLLYDQTRLTSRQAWVMMRILPLGSSAACSGAVRSFRKSTTPQGSWSGLQARTCARTGMRQRRSDLNQNSFGSQVEALVSRTASQIDCTMQ